MKKITLLLILCAVLSISKAQVYSRFWYGSSTNLVKRNPINDLQPSQYKYKEHRLYSALSTLGFSLGYKFKNKPFAAELGYSFTESGTSHEFYFQSYGDDYGYYANGSSSGGGYEIVTLLLRVN